MRALKTLARRVLGDGVIDAVNERLNTHRTRRTLDRIALVSRILPAFAAEGGRVLWIGCRRYTAAYPGRMQRAGVEFWTTDIAPEVEAWGAKGQHRTGDAREIDTVFADLTFDAVLCNGVLGYGVDSPEDQAATLRAMANVLRPGGRLLLGWNTDKIADPVAAGLVDPWFTPAPLADIPARLTCPPTTHVYDLLQRKT